MQLTLGEREQWCPGAWVYDLTFGNGKIAGMLIYSTADQGRGCERLLPGWNAWADFTSDSRLAPNLHVTRILGMRTMRQAVRATLAQIPANDAATDAFDTIHRRKA